MNNLFWKDPHRSQNGGVSRRTVLLSIVICALGVFLALRFGDDLSRKIVTDRDTVNHARVLTEADLVAKLDELLGSLSLHRKLAALDRQLANGSSVVEPDVEKASKEILAQLSSRLNRQYHVFRSTMDQLPKHTDLFTHFLPQYDDIQERFCADLAQLEAPLRSITRGASAGVPLLEHDLILETLSRYQLVVSQVSSRASLALERTIAVGADQLLFFIQIVVIGLAVLISVFLILVMQGRDRARAQESAAEAYESLVGVMEFMDPSWAIDTSGTVIYWNRAVEKLTGIPADEMIGKSNHEYALPFYGERRKVLIDLVLEWDEEIQKKYMFIDTLEDGSISAASFHPDLGSGTYLASSAQLLKTSSGKVIGAIETVRDITGQTESKEELFRVKEESQQALHLAEERLSALQKVRETSADALITFDAQKHILSANAAAGAIFGYSTEELAGQPMRMICESDCPSVTDQGNRIELEGRHKDGSRIPISVSVSQIIEDGKKVALANMRDLRIAREQEKQISHLESLLSLRSFDFINQGISVFDRDLNLLSANQAFLDLLEFPEEFRLPGTPFEAMLRFNAERGEYGEGDSEQQVQDRLALARKFEPHEFERTRKDGVIIHIAGTPIDEGIGGFITVYTDVTKARQDEAKQQSEISHLQSILQLEVMDHVSVGIAVYDADLKLIRANRFHDELYQIPERLREPGTSAASLIRFLADRGDYGGGDKEEIVKRALEALSSTRESTRDITLPDGRIVEVKSAPLDGGVALINTDVTQVRKALRRAKMTDAVTGLLTLEAAAERVEKYFPQLQEKDRQAIGIRLQVDRFGMVNEIYGENVGDQLLKQVSQRVRGVASDDAILGRAGGNELVLIDEAIDASNMANSVVKVLREAMKPPFYFRAPDGTRQHISLTLSGGIVCFPENGTDLEDLVNKSRLAMQYAASQGGDSFRFFDWKATRRRFTSDRISIENDLRTAIEEDQFFLIYQPQIDLQTSGIHGCEALIRWEHPQQGLISPLDFIPVAEETGLIVPIGDWVLRTACRQAKQWQDDGHSPFVLSVNVSAIQFRHEGIVDSVRGVLEETGLEPRYLELELTESIVADDLEGTRQILNELKGLGLSLAIDDFGTGYSSLAYLTQLPFDTLKIDQAFVRGKEKHNWAIVRAVCQLARSLGLSIVAEGVETIDHADMLTGLGCHIGQGYFFSRPLPTDDLENYFAEHDSRDADSDSDGEERKKSKLRVGLPTFGAINQFQKAALAFRAEHPSLGMEIHCDVSDYLIESLNLGELDLIVAITSGSIDIQPQHAWLEQPVWVGAWDFDLGEREAVPLLAHPEGSPFRKRTLDSLRQADRQPNIVYQSPALRGLINALAAGMGITALPLSAVKNDEAMKSGKIRILDHEKDHLPVLEPVQYGIYGREPEGESASLGQSAFVRCFVELIDSFGCERL